MISTAVTINDRKRRNRNYLSLCQKVEITSKLTYEHVLELFAESNKQIAETNRKAEEADKRIEKAAKGLDKRFATNCL